MIALLITAPIVLLQAPPVVTTVKALKGLALQPREGGAGE